MKKSATNILGNYKYLSIYDNVEYGVNIQQNHSTEAIIEVKCAKNRGYSIGNAIRREILLNAESLAIAAIKIHGVNHEYATIKGVSNQISEIIANLKKIIFVTNKNFVINDSNKSQVYVATLFGDSNKGDNVITAVNITLPENIIILNPTQEICKLDVNSSITIDIVIIYGSGFLSIDNIKFLPVLDNDFIKLDANFANNISVSIELNENIRSQTNDVLTININTSLAHNAVEIYHKAIKSLMNLMTVLYDTSYSFQHEISGINSMKNYKLSNNSYETSLQTLAMKGIMSYRIYSLLNKFGINTIRDLMNLTEQQLMMVEGIGQNALEEIKKLMKEFKVELNATIEDDTSTVLGKRQVNNIMDDNMVGSKNPNIINES